MFFFFSKGNWSFLIDYLLPKIQLPSAIILNWVVVGMNFKIKGCPLFYWKGNHHNPNSHSHEAIDTTEIHLRFLIGLYARLKWLYYGKFPVFRVQGWETAHRPSGQAEGLQRVHWNSCWVYGTRKGATVCSSSCAYPTDPASSSHRTASRLS